MTVRPAKAQISLGIRPVWSKSSLCVQWVAEDPSFLHADSEDSDQTGRMPRLIWIFARRTCHFVGFVMSRLKWQKFCFGAGDLYEQWWHQFKCSLRQKYVVPNLWQRKLCRLASAILSSQSCGISKTRNYGLVYIFQNIMYVIIQLKKHTALHFMT